MPTTLRHRRRARRARRIIDDPAEGRYLRVVEVVRRYKLERRLTDDREARWNHVDDLVPKSEATLLHERALKAMEQLIGGRWIQVDEVVPSRSPGSRMVAAPNPRDAVMDTATALYDEARALAARLQDAEVSKAAAARLRRADGPTAIATAEVRQVGADLARVVADLEHVAAPRHENPAPVHQDAPPPGRPVRADERNAASSGSHAA
jgi:hypothetical protein